MFSPEFFKSMTSQLNPADLKLMCQQMTMMSDAELSSRAAMLGNHGLSPQALRAAANSMSNLDPETLDSLKQQTTQRMAATPAPTTQPKPSSLPQAKLKEEGNKLFGAGAYLEALEKYQEALVALASAALSDEVIALEVTCRLNIANCCSKLNDFERAIEECKKVSARQALVFGENHKANYRIALCLDKLNRVEEAWPYISKAKLDSSGDKVSKVNSVVSLYNEIKAKTGNVDPEPKPAPLSSPAAQPVSTQVVPNLSMPSLSKEEMDKGIAQFKGLSSEAKKQQFDMLKSTDPRLLAEVFKSQGLNMEPEDIAKMRDFITEDKIEQLSGLIGDDGAPSLGTEGSSTAETIQKAAANPAMRKMISEMLSKQVGRPASELEGIINIAQKVVGVFLGVKRVYTKATCGWRKYLWMGGFAVWVAYLFS